MNVTHKTNQNLLLAPVDAIIHCANCQGVMGAGIAKQIARKWPEVLDGDQNFQPFAPEDRLGDFSLIRIQKPDSQIKYVYNLYGQLRYGRIKRHLDYEAFYTGLEKIKQSIVKNQQKFNKNHPKRINSVALPYKIGCNNAGGDWVVVGSMIDAILGPMMELDVWVCQFEG